MQKNIRAKQDAWNKLPGDMHHRRMLQKMANKFQERFKTDTLWWESLEHTRTKIACWMFARDPPRKKRFPTVGWGPSWTKAMRGGPGARAGSEKQASTHRRNTQSNIAQLFFGEGTFEESDWPSAQQQLPMIIAIKYRSWISCWCFVAPGQVLCCQWWRAHVCQKASQWAPWLQPFLPSMHPINLCSLVTRP